MKQLVRHCEECKHSQWGAFGFELECKLGHRMRFCTPKNPMDNDYGWKRKCNDFKAISNAKDHLQERNGK